MKTKEEYRQDCIFAYREKKISKKLATARLIELGFKQWEIEIYLDTEPEIEP